MSEGSVGKQVFVGVTGTVLAAVILTTIGLNSDGSDSNTPTRTDVNVAALRIIPEGELTTDVLNRIPPEDLEQRRLRALGK